MSLLPYLFDHRSIRQYFRRFIYWDEWFSLGRVCKDLRPLVGGVNWSPQEREEFVMKIIMRPLLDMRGVETNAVYLNTLRQASVDKVMAGSCSDRTERVLTTYFSNKLLPHLQSLCQLGQVYWTACYREHRSHLGGHGHPR
jgi:hypothetical protein